MLSTFHFLSFYNRRFLKKNNQLFMLYPSAQLPLKYGGGISVLHQQHSPNMLNITL